MKVYDISWPISESTTEYKNKESIFFTKLKDFDIDHVRESKFCMSTHTGTHVDAPTHFMRQGKTIDNISLDQLIGGARVLDFTKVREKITADDLARYTINEHEIILLRTANSAKSTIDDFEADFIYLDPSGAKYLADKKVKAVGIDYLGIERGDPEHTTHVTLFNANVVIIEGLRLGHVQSGDYFLVCLPLRLLGLEAAPARAILMSQ